MFPTKPIIRPEVMATIVSLTVFLLRNPNDGVATTVSKLERSGLKLERSKDSVARVA